MRAVLGDMVSVAIFTIVMQGGPTVAGSHIICETDFHFRIPPDDPRYYLENRYVLNHGEIFSPWLYEESNSWLDLQHGGISMVGRKDPCEDPLPAGYLPDVAIV